MNSRDQIVLFKPQYSSLKITNKKKSQEINIIYENEENIPQTPTAQ